MGMISCTVSVNYEFYCISSFIIAFNHMRELLFYQEVNKKCLDQDYPETSRHFANVDLKSSEPCGTT